MSRVNPRLCLIAWARRASIFARECSAYIRTAVSLVPQVSRGKPNRSYTPPDQISELSLKSHSQQPECSAPVCPVVCRRTASTAAAFRTAPSSNLFGCSIRGQLCWSGSGPKRFPRRQKPGSNMTGVQLGYPGRFGAAYRGSRQKAEELCPFRASAASKKSITSVRFPPIADVRASCDS